MSPYPNLVQYRLFEEFAENLLDDFARRSGRTLRLPIPIEDVGRVLYGLTVRAQNSDFAAGALFEDSGVIYVNAAQQANPLWGEQRTRFTIAHEVAHRALPTVDDPAAAIMYGVRGTETHDQKRQMSESAADQVAAALLMPRVLLRVELALYNRIDGKALRQLARAFNVSLAAMGNRLRYLHAHAEPLDRWIDPDMIERLITAPDPDWQELEEAHSRATLEARPKDLAGKQGKIERLKQAINDFLFNIGVPPIARSNRKKGEAALLPAAVLRRPMVVEVAGAPGSEKDSQIEALLGYLRDGLRYRVLLVKLPQDDGPGDNGGDILGYYQSLFTLLANLSGLAGGHSRYDAAIVPRGLFDHLAWLCYYTRLGRLTQDEQETYARLLLDPRWRKVTDLVVLLDGDAGDPLQACYQSVNEEYGRLFRAVVIGE